MKSYNLDAQMGGDIDDMELVHQYGLDSAVAYTPSINQAMRKAIFDANLADGARKGDPPEKVRAEAVRRMNQAAEFERKIMR